MKKKLERVMVDMAKLFNKHKLNMEEGIVVIEECRRKMNKYLVGEAIDHHMRLFDGPTGKLRKSKKVLR